MSCHQCPSASSCAQKEPETKPLGKITALLADLGLEITYAYDDLIFVQECSFLLQFTNDPAALRLFYNVECDPDMANIVASSIVLEFKKGGFSVEPSGKYTLTENEDETIAIAFA